MSIDTADIGEQATPAGEDSFDLDITVLEASDEAASLINLTDDNCGSTCPRACATAIV